MSNLVFDLLGGTWIGEWRGGYRRATPALAGGARKAARSVHGSPSG